MRAYLVALTFLLSGCGAAFVAGGTVVYINSLKKPAPIPPSGTADLVVSALRLTTPAGAAAGPARVARLGAGIRADLVVTNQGNLPMGVDGSVGLYLSRDKVIDPAEDLELTRRPVPVLAGRASLALENLEISLPPEVADEYKHAPLYLGAVVSTAGEKVSRVTVEEPLAANNSRFANVPVQVKPAPAPAAGAPTPAADLESVYVAGPGYAIAGQQVSVEFEVVNRNHAEAPLPTSGEGSTFRAAIYLVEDSAQDSPSTSLLTGNRLAYPDLAEIRLDDPAKPTEADGASGRITATFTVPIESAFNAAGLTLGDDKANYRFVLVMDETDQVKEADEGNNLLVADRPTFLVAASNYPPQAEDLGSIPLTVRNPVDGHQDVSAQDITTEHRAVEYFSFDVKEGGALIVDVAVQAALDSEIDPVLELLDRSSGSALASDDDSGGGLYPRARIFLNPGSYLLAVHPYAGVSRGAFDLFVQQYSATGTGNQTVQAFQTSPETTRILTELDRKGTWTAQGAVQPNDNDKNTSVDLNQFSFQLNFSAEVTFSLEVADRTIHVEDLDVEMKGVRGGDALLIGADFQTLLEPALARRAVKRLEPGVYFLTVTNLGFDAIDYTLRLKVNE